MSLYEDPENNISIEFERLVDRNVMKITCSGKLNTESECLAIGQDPELTSVQALKDGFWDERIMREMAIDQGGLDAVKNTASDDFLVSAE